jgi:hypothetical protein
MTVFQAGDDAEQSAFAAAARADNTDELSVADGQIDILQGDHLSGTELKLFVEPLNDQACAC